MKYTKQEKKNHNNFIFSLGNIFLLLSLMIWSMTNDYILFHTIGIIGIIINHLWMFHIGYSHGWELKRISLK
jgi:hypothetical protein